MKRQMLRNTLFTFMLIISCFPSIAQDYIVTTKGDTLKGKVKILSYSPEKKVQVINDQNKKFVISIFSTSTVLADGETYNPVRGDKGYDFMKLLKGGYLSLYIYKVQDQTSYEVYYLVMRDGRKTVVPNLNFKNKMTEFLGADCPDVSYKISNGHLGRKDLDKIIDIFNGCIDTNTKSFQQATDLSKELASKINVWNNFEERVKVYDDFDQKNNALEIIAEIKSKIQLTNKIPNYLVDGLKNALAKTPLLEDLNSILNTPN